MNLGGAKLDLPRGLLLDAEGKEIPLRAQSMKVLQLLAGRAGEVVTKDETFGAVWGDVHVTDDSLTQCVGEIRRAIGDSARQVLQTVPKRGYRLVPVSGPVDEPRVSAPVAAAPSKPRWLVPVALALVAGAGLGGWSLWPAKTTRLLPSIAVIPFEDLSGVPRWERLGRGLAAEIGADLSRSWGLVVIPAETVEAAAGGLGAVGDALDACFVLGGTLQADGDELRITAWLTDAEGDRVIWSNRWARPAEDLFALQDEIVGQIGGSLDGTWTSALARTVREGAKGRPTSSLEAYELYLLGAEAKHEFTSEAYVQSVGYLRRALEIDPDFVRAMVKPAIVVMYQADTAASEAEAAALMAESFALAERAVALDPNDPMALTRLSCTRVIQGRREEAWPYAERAVEIAPTNPDVLAIAAWCYMFADQGPGPREWAARASN